MHCHCTVKADILKCADFDSETNGFESLLWEYIFYYFTSSNILRILNSTWIIDFITEFTDNKLSGSWKYLSQETA